MDVLRIGTLLAPSMAPAHKAAAVAVAADLERNGLGSATFVGSVDYRSYQQGWVDVAFVCGLAYVALSEAPASPEPIAAPVLSGRRYQDRPIYFSDVVVRSGSPARSFDDLEGSRFAYNEPLSQSGSGVVLAHLAATGRNLGFFSEMIRSGGHANSMAMVVDGSADAAAVDSQLLEFVMREDPEGVAGLEVVDHLGPSTIQPVTIASGVADPVRRSVIESLLTLHSRPPAKLALDRCGVSRFAPVAGTDYDDIRTMAAMARNASLSLD